MRSLSHLLWRSWHGGSLKKLDRPPFPAARSSRFFTLSFSPNYGASCNNFQLRRLQAKQLGLVLVTKFGDWNFAIVYFCICHWLHSKYVMTKLAWPFQPQFMTFLGREPTSIKQTYTLGLIFFETQRFRLTQSRFFWEKGSEESCLGPTTQRHKSQDIEHLQSRNLETCCCQLIHDLHQPTFIRKLEKSPPFHYYV